MHLKVFFRTIDLKIDSEIEETAYLDYEAGIVAGRITKTKSRSTSPNLPIHDEGLSQSVAYNL